MPDTETLICSIQTDPEARRRIGWVVVEHLDFTDRIVSLSPATIRTAHVWLPADAVLVIDAAHADHL